MQHTLTLVGARSAVVMNVITDAIRSVSARARDVVVTPECLLFEELGLDSLDLVAVILQVQDRFEVEIEPDEIPSMRRVEDLIASLTKLLRAAA